MRFVICFIDDSNFEHELVREEIAVNQTKALGCTIKFRKEA